MTMPLEYALASSDFEAFMTYFMQEANLPTHRRAYHSIRAVLHVFRSHLTTADALKFANVLPPVLRAIFVEDWNPSDDPSPFPGLDNLLLEVKAERRDHNLAHESVLGDAARSLRRHVDEKAFDRVLKRLPEGAARFWSAG